MPEGARHRAYLALGSNIEPERNLPAAVAELWNYGTIAAVSGVWETPPLGFPDQPNFLNAAVLLETPLDAAALRNEAIAAIEQKLHRTRDPNNRNAPRTIDIDIALFDRAVLRIGPRQIPDPDILKRAFVAVPLAELDPEYVHPQVGRTLAAIGGDFADIEPPMIARSDVDLRNANVARNALSPSQTSQEQTT